MESIEFLIVKIFYWLCGSFHHAVLLTLAAGCAVARGACLGHLDRLVLAVLSFAGANGVQCGEDAQGYYCDN